MATTKKPAAPNIEQWIADAEQKAQKAIDDAISLEVGDVIPRDKALRYVVLDAQLPASNIARHRARLTKLGYRDVTDQIEAVIGYDTFVVVAIPVEVYRKVIRPERLRRLRPLIKRFGIQQGMVSRPLADSLT